jgi:hypothetical protein
MCHARAAIYSYWHVADDDVVHYMLRGAAPCQATHAAAGHVETMSILLV